MAARLAAAMAALKLEDARKFRQLWLEGGMSESLGMTPMLKKMRHYLTVLKFQLSALAKLELRFDGQLCERSAEEFADAGFAEELSFDGLPAMVREHLDSTAVRFEKVPAAAADLNTASRSGGFHDAVALFLVREPPSRLQRWLGDVSVAYHHVQSVRLNAIPYLGFECQVQFYRCFGAADRPGHGPADFPGGHGSLRPYSALRGESIPPLFGRYDCLAAPGAFVLAGGPTPVVERVGRALAHLSEEEPSVAAESVPCQRPGHPPPPVPGAHRQSRFSRCQRHGEDAVIWVEEPEPASSFVVRALRRTAPPGMSHDELVERARRGIEFMTAFPPLVRDDSSALRELWGVPAFVVAAGSLLAGGHHRVVMDNLGSVFITGGAVPPFAVGGKRLGEFVSGRSPNPSPQALIVDAQIGGGVHLTLERVPREVNQRACAGRLPLARVSDATPRSPPPLGVVPRAGWRGRTVGPALHRPLRDG